MSSVLIFVILAVAILVIGLVIGLVAFVNGRRQPPRRDPPSTAPSGTLTEERPPDAPVEPPPCRWHRPAWPASTRAAGPGAGAARPT